MNLHRHKISLSQIINVLKSEKIEVDIENFQEITVDRVSDLSTASPDTVFFYNGADGEKVQHLRDCVLICHPNNFRVHESVRLLKTSHPRLVFIIVMQKISGYSSNSGIHLTAIVDEEACIHPSASIGPYCIIGKSRIGENSILQAHITINANTVIGKNVVIEAGSCIGQTGQGGELGPDGKLWMMPQIGGTIIGDDCFIGSQVVIARGAISNTVIKKSCRILHGARIGHNCIIEDGTFIANSAVIGGSVRLGKNCMIGINSSIRDNITIGSNVTVGVGGAVVSNFRENNITLVGIPARVLNKAKLEN